jgi:hypothetical protein
MRRSRLIWRTTTNSAKATITKPHDRVDEGPDRDLGRPYRRAAWSDANVRSRMVSCTY